MKVIKKKLSEEDNDADFDGQEKYLRKIAYWVGYFIFEFNDLDDTVTRALAEHIDGHLEKNEYAYIFLSGLTFNQKVELLERYCNFHLKRYGNDGKHLEMKTEAEEIIGQLKAIGKIRNTIVHANYYTLDKNGNIKEKTRFAVPEIEQYWVSITRDLLVDKINFMIDFTPKIGEFSEMFLERLY